MTSREEAERLLASIDDKYLVEIDSEGHIHPVRNPLVPVIVKRPTLLRISEGSQRQEPLRPEVRSFNNSKSSSTATETITIRCTSRVSASVELGRSRALSGTAGVGYHNIVSAQTSLRNELTRHYSVHLDAEVAYEQSTVINIPAHTNVEVIFHWYRIWTTGMITIADLANPAIEVAEAPFEITFALNFDKETRDII